MLNKKIASEIAVGIILLVAVVVGSMFLMQNEKTENIEQPSLPTGQPPGKASIEMNVRMCTQEAKLCDDGKTYVSRTGPNCEFAACQTSENNKNTVDFLNDWSVAESTNSWKTYSNNEYGFKFSVPSNFIAIERLYYHDNLSLGGESGGHIGVRIIDKELNPNKITDLAFPDSAKFDKKSIKIMNVDGRNMYGYISGDGGISGIVFQVPLEKKTIAVSFMDADSGNESYDVSEQVMLTFKFTK